MEQTEMKDEVLAEQTPIPSQSAPDQQTMSPEDVPSEKTPRKKKKLYAEHILAIMAGCLALILAVLVVICYPYFHVEDDPELLISKNPPATIPPVTQAPDEATQPVPEPEKNPYGKLDFQYDGRYLSCLKADTVPGIDVSYYQGDIDWAQVKASGIQFAIIRIGYRGYGQEGKLVEDQMAIENLEGALEAGLDVGVYFFSQAITVEEALEEADFVLERIKNYDLTMPVVYDWEYVSEEARTANMDRETLTECYLAFCGKIQEAGYTPMPYFNTYQSRSLMTLTELEAYPFWLALYSDRMTFPYRIEMWQYTDSGRVPGIEGNVDINIYFTEE